MPSIDREIDAAVVLMKARAAEFDETKTMEGMTAARCAVLAYQNIQKVVRGIAGEPLNRTDLIDTAVHCALALSLLPKEGEG